MIVVLGDGSTERKAIMLSAPSESGVDGLGGASVVRDIGEDVEKRGRGREKRGEEN